ncbi:MAG: hypothetical protein BSR46_04930 [Candidatus Dactylopiibacterium carminicum]|nr:MAG: hypothetical protein BSR46_04930 [Candidatus Dactylopiibacterium carminicum]
MRSARGYIAATAGVAGLSLLSEPLAGRVDAANVVMLYLLLVVGVALLSSRGAAAWCALCGVLAFDVFHVPPRLSLRVGDMQYLVTFVVMLLVGLLLAHLTARLRAQAAAAAAEEEAVRHQYGLARELAGCIEVAQVCEAVDAFVRRECSGHARIWWLGRDEVLQALGPDGAEEVRRTLVEVALAEGHTREMPDPADPGGRLLMLVLEAPRRRRGVLLLEIPVVRAERLSRSRAEALALLVATALERLHYVGVAQQATVEMERERLRSTLLAALSHDIRTPLTVLVGQADALYENEARGMPVSRLAAAMREQAMHMSELVDNLLDMARLQSGRLQLRRDWQSVEEIVGAATAHLEVRLQQHCLRIELPSDLPLLEFDAVLIERVLCNLLENAAKYSPPGSTVHLRARLLPGMLQLMVEDDGPGLSAQALQHLFEPFQRGETAGSVPGLGLGLSICRLIVEAHGGQLTAANRVEGGVCFAFTLPLSAQPALAPEPEDV